MNKPLKEDYPSNIEGGYLKALDEYIDYLEKELDSAIFLEELTKEFIKKLQTHIKIQNA